MRTGIPAILLSATALLSGCTEVSSVLPRSVTCAGTEAELCGRVARLAVDQMNLGATGPITQVTLLPMDCAKAARSNFHAVWAAASACWAVTVTGERSHGGGVVVLWPNGDLEPFW